MGQREWTITCLSCHNGTVALDSFGENIGTEFIDPEYVVVDDDLTLSPNHPVSVPYDEARPKDNPESAVEKGDVGE